MGFSKPLKAPISDPFSAPRRRNNGALSESCAKPGWPKTREVKVPSKSGTKYDSYGCGTNNRLFNHQLLDVSTYAQGHRANHISRGINTTRINGQVTKRDEFVVAQQTNLKRASRSNPQTVEDKFGLAGRGSVELPVV